MGAAREDLQFTKTGRRHYGITNHLQPRAMLAGAEGFEPSNTGSKVPRLTAWPRPIESAPFALLPFRTLRHRSRLRPLRRDAAMASRSNRQKLEKLTSG